MREEHIGARVAAERRLRGLTQRQLADRVHVSLSLITKVERGDRPATPALVAAVARVLTRAATTGAVTLTAREPGAGAATLTVTGTPRDLPSDARLALYRVAQEALTNVRRHADAERVDVALAWSPGEVVLTVEDRAGVPVGAGGEAPRRVGPGGGHGLTGMRERAELLGGTLDAGPTPDGFRVRLALPA